jgi:hypothetical protein
MDILSDDILIHVLAKYDKKALRFVTSSSNNYKKIINEFGKNRICEIAARIGHLELLIFAHENGCPWEYYYYRLLIDRSICEISAKNGHLDCLKYLHKNSCPWDKWTCAHAAFKGHLECLKYAHEQGCPWDRNTCAYAAQNGHLECLKYICDNKCLGYEEYLHLLE